MALNMNSKQPNTPTTKSLLKKDVSNKVLIVVLFFCIALFLIFFFYFQSISEQPTNNKFDSLWGNVDKSELVIACTHIKGGNPDVFPSNAKCGGRSPVEIIFIYSETFLGVIALFLILLGALKYHYYKNDESKRNGGKKIISAGIGLLAFTIYVWLFLRIIL